MEHHTPRREQINTLLDDGLTVDWYNSNHVTDNLAVVYFSGRTAESKWKIETIDVIPEIYEEMKSELLYGNRERLQ